MNWLEIQPGKHPRTASRLVAGEAVIVLPEEGTVKVLNEVGSRIWELADGHRTVGEIAQTVCQEYEVECAQAERETIDFVQEMVKDELMLVEPAA